MVWHVDNKTAPLVKPRKQPVFSEETRYFTDEIGQTPTVPQADWFNMVQDELLQLAKALGVTPDKLNDGQIGPALAGKLQAINNLIPKVLDSLGDDRNNPASQRVVNDVNRTISDSMFGIDQGTFNVTDERVPGVKYFNSSSRAILVTLIIKDYGNNGWSFDVGERTITFPNIENEETHTITILIPPHTSYGNLNLPEDNKGNANIYRIWMETR